MKGYTPVRRIISGSRGTWESGVDESISRTSVGSFRVGAAKTPAEPFSSPLRSMLINVNSSLLISTAIRGRTDFSQSRRFSKIYEVPPKPPRHPFARDCACMEHNVKLSILH